MCAEIGVQVNIRMLKKNWAKYEQSYNDTFF